MKARPAPSYAAYFSALAFGLALPGCQGRTRHEEPAAAASSASATPPAPGSPAAPGAAVSASAGTATRDAWYAGAWTGTYQSAPHHIELPPKQGGLPEWKVDDPKRGVGNGTLTLTAQADGTVVGSSTGALGEHVVRGAFDGDAFTAQLVPKATDGSGFAGTVVGHRDEDRIVGTLQASSTDGRLARSGTVTLTKAAP